MPVKQCLYCGRLDKDKRDVPFKTQTKLCHVKGCHTSDSDPKRHLPDCCSTAWKQEKKSFDASCGHYTKLMIRYEQEGKKIKPPEMKEKIVQLFRDFCEKCYQRNLMIQNDVRPLQVKSEGLKWRYER